MDKPSIVIIGPGRVGTALAVLAERAGYKIAAIGARNLDKGRLAAGMIAGDVRVGAPAEVAGAGELVLLTVSDDAIEPLCRQLADAFSRDAIVAHCCGAISSEVLAPAREKRGSAVGSMHPLQTFPNVEAGIKKFPGTYCFCEGDAPAVEALMSLAADLGGRPVRMSSSGKLLYHASAVMACNYFTALIDAALATAQLAHVGRDDALAALEPLVRATADNVFSVGPEKALTGPIARGDAGLVERQYRFLRAAGPQLGEIYRVLGLQAVDVALRKGTIDQDKARQLRNALQ